MPDQPSSPTGEPPPPGAPTGSIPAPASIWVFARRRTMSSGGLDPAALEVITRQVTREAQTVGYQRPYGLVLWQEDDDRWSILVPWQNP